MGTNVLRAATLLTGLVLGTVCGISYAWSEEADGPTLADLAARLENTEKRIAELENQDSGSETSHTPGIVAGADLAFLKPFQSEGRAWGFDYQAAPRIWLGWSGENGVGARTRWFSFEGENPDGDMVKLQTTTFDVELTDALKLGSKWDVVLSAGVRYAEYLEAWDVRFPEGITGSAGPVFGIELYRPIFGNTSVYFVGREAVMFGRFFDQHPLVLGHEEDLVYSITELQAGIQWDRHLSGTTSVFVRAGIEAQIWAGPSDLDTESFGLFGGTFSIGLAR